RTEAAASTPREAATPTPCGAPASTRQAVAPIREAPASTRQAPAPSIESAEPTSAESPPQTIPQLPQRNDREDPRVPGQGTPEALRRRGAARHSVLFGGRGGERGAGARRPGLGRQGADSRRRPRQ